MAELQHTRLKRFRAAVPGCGWEAVRGHPGGTAEELFRRAESAAPETRFVEFRLDSLAKPAAALAAISLTGASPATLHYVERTLLSYRLAGVDKDQATRDHIQSLHEKSTRLSLEFSRNIQEGGKTIQATVEELAGLPPDYIAATSRCRRRRHPHH